MILYINTKEQNSVTVSLKKDGKTVDSLTEEREYGSQVLLPMIEKILKRSATKSNKNPKVSIQNHLGGGRTNSGIWGQIEGIEVEVGPGSFTGLRVGASVANALGFALNISVNGKKMETELEY